MPDSVDQATIDKCVARSFRNAADINAAFGGSFIDFFNRKVGPTPPFHDRPRIDTAQQVRDRFDAFWNQIPAIFGKPAITAIEFCALMSIAMRESSGNLWEHPELVNGPNVPHPGLAYPFDRIAGLKQSYNTLSGNRTALQLFGDPLYIGAHGALPGRPAVPLDQRWGGEAWPDPFPTSPSPAVNGFVEQADFFKFRGRGVIQTTGRGHYLPLIDFILGVTGNATLQNLAQAWKNAVSAVPPAQQRDAIATVSTNDDWKTAFGEGAVLAAGVRLHSAGAGNYLQLAHDAPTLNGGTGVRGSLFFMASHINGGNYANEVVPMMRAMIVAVAAEPAAAPALV
jgi:hypothetical protein